MLLCESSTDSSLALFVLGAFQDQLRFIISLCIKFMCVCVCSCCCCCCCCLCLSAVAAFIYNAVIIGTLICKIFLSFIQSFPLPLTLFLLLLLLCLHIHWLDIFLSLKVFPFLLFLLLLPHFHLYDQYY